MTQTHTTDLLKWINIIMGLPGNHYQVLVYVVEENGLPFQKPAATPKSIGITGI